MHGLCELAPAAGHRHGRPEVFQGDAAALAVAGLLATTAVFGREILSFLNVGIDDFRIAGGRGRQRAQVAPLEL